jgi:hypothetical protein
MGLGPFLMFVFVGVDDKWCALFHFLLDPWLQQRGKKYVLGCARGRAGFTVNPAMINTYIWSGVDTSKHLMLALQPSALLDLHSVQEQWKEIRAIDWSWWRSGKVVGNKVVAVELAVLQYRSYEVPWKTA